MGFCLLRETETPDFYFAVNVAHVDDIAQSDHQGSPACLLKFKFGTQDFVPMAFGTILEIRRLLIEASKVGLGKIETQVLTGQNKQKATPLLLNNPDRVALVRELRADEFAAFNEECPTASQMFFSDGTQRLIAGRPGVFATKVNAGGKVPVGPSPPEE